MRSHGEWRVLISFSFCWINKGQHSGRSGIDQHVERVLSAYLISGGMRVCLVAFSLLPRLLGFGFFLLVYCLIVPLFFSYLLFFIDLASDFAFMAQNRDRGYGVFLRSRGGFLSSFFFPIFLSLLLL